MSEEHKARSVVILEKSVAAIDTNTMGRYRLVNKPEALTIL